MINRFSQFISFVLLTVAVTCSANASPRIGIIDFESRISHRYSWNVQVAAADMLTTELVKATNMEVYERERMSAILQEQNFGQSGRVDPATAAEIGRLAGLDYIVTGAITEFGMGESGGGGGGIKIGSQNFVAAVDVRIIDVQSGRIVFADTGSGVKSQKKISIMGFGGGSSNNQKNETEAMRRAMKDVAKKIGDAELEKQLKSGTSSNARAASNPNDILIAYIDGSSVTINKGTEAGLKVGQKYTIKRQKGVIKDPATGRVIKVQYTTVGQVEVTKVESSYADGKLISDKGVEVGDKVDVPGYKGARAAPKPKSIAAAPKPRAPEPVTEKPKGFGLISSLAGGNVRERDHGDIEVDTFDEDALEDYYESLKNSITWISTLSSLTSEQVAANPQMSQISMFVNMFSGQLESSRIELEDWPLDAKKKGWKLMGKKIKKYSKLFEKHRNQILTNKALPEQNLQQISSLELITEQSLFAE